MSRDGNVTSILITPNQVWKKVAEKTVHKCFLNYLSQITFGKVIAEAREPDNGTRGKW